MQTQKPEIIMKPKKQKLNWKGALNMKEMEYSRQGDYLLPNVTVPEEPEAHFGKYALLRRNYLRKERYGLFITLLTQGRLNQHLMETQEEAGQRMEQIMKRMAEAQGVTEEMKAKDQMAWTGLTNSIRHSAEEIIMKELIYD